MQVCGSCHAEVYPKKAKRGYAAITWALFGFLMLAVGLQYLDYQANVGGLKTAAFRDAAIRHYETPTAYKAMALIGLWGWLAHVGFRGLTKRNACPNCDGDVR